MAKDKSDGRKMVAFNLEDRKIVEGAARRSGVTFPEFVRQAALTAARDADFELIVAAAGRAGLPVATFMRRETLVAILKDGRRARNERIAARIHALAIGKDEE